MGDRLPSQNNTKQYKYKRISIYLETISGCRRGQTEGSDTLAPLFIIFSSPSAAVEWDISLLCISGVTVRTLISSLGVENQ